MLFAAALLVTSAPFATTADKPKTDSDIPPRIDARVEAWQPVASERRLDEVGWAADIRKAQSLAKENNRPVFLFTYNGCSDRENALCLQRC
jgi:hypothetical protein